MVGATAAHPHEVIGPPGAARGAHSNRSARRRLYVSLLVVFGVVLTLGLTYRVAHKPGVFWSEVKVLFLAPRSDSNPNILLTTSGSLITAAGMVARLVDPNAPTARVVSPDVTLVDQGIRNGYAVTLPNDGGQWENNFDQALLDVQAVSPNAIAVSLTMTRLLKEINGALATLQDEAHVALRDRIHTSLSPGQPEIYYARGSRTRSVAVTFLLGVALTGAAVGLLRRRARPREMPSAQQIGGA